MADGVDKKIVYGVQVCIATLLILFCLLNLTLLENEKLEKLWIGLLGSCVGYLIPSPMIR
jgi:hypothetical protein